MAAAPQQGVGLRSAGSSVYYRFVVSVWLAVIILVVFIVVVFSVRIIIAIIIVIISNISIISIISISSSSSSSSSSGRMTPCSTEQWLRDVLLGWWLQGLHNPECMEGVSQSHWFFGGYHSPLTILRNPLHQSAEKLGAPRWHWQGGSSQGTLVVASDCSFCSKRPQTCSSIESAQTQAAVRHVEKEVAAEILRGVAFLQCQLSDSGGIGGRWEDLFEVCMAWKELTHLALSRLQLVVGRNCRPVSRDGEPIHGSSQTFHHRDSKLNLWHCVVSDKELSDSTRHAFFTWPGSPSRVKICFYHSPIMWRLGLKWRFPRMGVPPKSSIWHHLTRIFHYKASIWGYPQDYGNLYAKPLLFQIQSCQCARSFGRCECHCNRRLALPSRHRFCWAVAAKPLLVDDYRGLYYPI